MRLKRKKTPKERAAHWLRDRQMWSRWFAVLPVLLPDGTRAWMEWVWVREKFTGYHTKRCYSSDDFYMGTYRLPVFETEHAPYGPMPEQTVVDVVEWTKVAE